MAEYEQMADGTIKVTDTVEQVKTIDLRMVKEEADRTIDEANRSIDRFNQMVDSLLDAVAGGVDIPKTPNKIANVSITYQ